MHKQGNPLSDHSYMNDLIEIYVFDIKKLKYTLNK